MDAWARKLHDEFCSYSCSEENIVVEPFCRQCGLKIKDAVSHKGENVSCDSCFNNKLISIF